MQKTQTNFKICEEHQTKDKLNKRLSYQNLPSEIKSNYLRPKATS